MRTISFVVLIAGAVLAAASCTHSPTSPGANPMALKGTLSDESATGIKAADLMGTWEATKAEVKRYEEVGGGFVEVVGSRRDLVAQGGTITLVFEPNSQALGNAMPPGKYTVTATLPGTKPGLDTGFWFCGNVIGGGIDQGGPATGERFQIDFYPASLPDPEYGEVPAFLAVLSGDTLWLWDSGLRFLPLGLGDGYLNFVFTRK